MKKDFENSQLLLYSPLFFGLGIGLFFLINFDIPLLYLGIGTGFIGIITFLLRPTKFYTTSLFVFIMLLGYSCVNFHSSYKNSPIPRSYYGLWIDARITNIELFPSAQRFMLEDVKVIDKDWHNFPNKIRIKSNGIKNYLNVGDRIKVRVNLMPPPLPVYPRSYDFSTKAWFENIGAVGYNISKIQVIPSDNKELSYFEKFTILMGEIRKTISLKIRDSLPKDVDRVAIALVTGEQSSINNKLLQDYRDTGLAHILSVSGMHMSALAFLLFAFFRTVFALFPNFVLYYDIKKISAFLALFITFLYLMISGLAIPTQRSFIMVFVMFFAILINRRAISLRSVAIAGLIIMIFSPQSVLNPGFQMSFAAVAMLIAFYENNYINKGKTLTSMLFIYIYSIILTAFIGTISTSFYAIYHFNKFPVYSILANLMATTIFGFLIMPFLLIAVVIMPFNLQYYPLQIAGFGIDWMNKMTSWIADFPFAVIMFPQMSFWVVLSFTIGGYFFILNKTKWRYIGLLPLIPMIIGFYIYKKPDFIINSESTLVAVNVNNDLLLSPGRGNRMERSSWLAINTQEYDKEAKKKAKDYFSEICHENICNYKKGEYRFEFITNKKVKGRELYIYHNNQLYQKVTKNDLRDNKTMLFYVEKKSLIVDTVKMNKIRWWK